jgi:hypothetical protein
MRVLIYKRTHQGDPDSSGWFGQGGCMGRVRCWNFDAVIGVGGMGSEPVKNGIAYKLNWIGIGAHKENHQKNGGPVVTFKHFCLFENTGKELSIIAQYLAERLYSKNPPRLFFSDNSTLNTREKDEIERILKMARDARPSMPYRTPQKRAECPKKCSVCPSKHF